MADTDSTPSTPAETDCLVCGSGKSTPKNEILFCDGPNCDIPVHQKCYGVPVVPEGNWYCQRCEDRVSAQNTPACCCPIKHGAFKRTNIPNQYIHVACARFQPTLDTTKDPILFDRSLARKQRCSLCGSDFGIVAGCHEPGCTQAMHATCALNASLLTKGSKRKEIYCQAHRDSSILNKVMRATSTIGGANSSTSKRPHGKSLFPSRSSKRAKYYGESSDSNDESDDGSEAEHDDDDDDDDEEMEEEEEELERGGNTATRRSPSSSTSSRSGHQSGTSGGIGISNSTTTLAGTGNTASSTAAPRKLKRPGISRQKSRRRSDSDSDAVVEDDQDDEDDDGAALGSSSSSSSHSVSPQRKHPRAENPENSTRQRLLQQLAQRKRSGAGLGSGGGGGGSGSSGGNLGASSGGFGSGPGGLAAMTIRTLGNAGPPPSSSTAGTKAGSTQYTNSNQGSPLLGSIDRFPNTDNKRASGLPPSVTGYSNPSSPVQSRFQHERASPKMGTVPTFAPPPPSTAPGVKQNNHIGNQEQTNGHHPHHPHHHQHHHHQQQQQQQQQYNHHHSQSFSRTATQDTASLPSPDDAPKDAILRQNLAQIFQFLQIAVPAPAPLSGTNSNGVHQNGSNHAGGGMIEFHPDRLDSYVQALRDSLLGPASSPEDTKGKHPPPPPPPSSALANSNAVETALDPKKRNMIVDRVLREVGL